MSIKKLKPRRPAVKKHEPDWAALAALTDEEIDAQIAADPDVAPDISDWSLDDPKVRIMVPTDVKAIRAKFGLSQQRFAKTFALNLATLRDWEQQRRMPHGPARTLLQIIDREPDAVRRALGAKTKAAHMIRKPAASTSKPAHRQPAARNRNHEPARRAAGKEA
jgi:putative transcriptional regulator